MSQYMIEGREATMSEVHPMNALGLIDIVMNAGVDEAELLRGLDLSRTSLQTGEWISWSSYIALLHQVRDLLGEERLIEVIRGYGTAQQDVRALAQSIGSPAALIRYHVEQLMPSAWRVFDNTVEQIDERHVRTTCRLHDGVQPGSQTFFLIYAHSVAGITLHLDLPICEVEFQIDDRSGCFDFTLPAGPVMAMDAAVALRADLDFVSMLRSGRGNTRERARADIVARLGNALQECDELHALAETVVDGFVEALNVNGAQVALMHDNVLVPLRERGVREGIATRVPLSQQGQQHAELTVWTAPHESSEARAALNVIAPWVAVALSTARALGELRRERAEHAALRAERDGLATALDDVLALLPGVVYVLGPDGAVEPKTDPARKAFAADCASVTETIAREVRLLDDGQGTFSVVPVRVGDQLQRVIVIERATARSVEAACDRLANTWGLTTRQREVLVHVVRGLTNKEVATALSCAEVTVESHLTAIFQRAGIASRQALSFVVLTQAQ